MHPVAEDLIRLAREAREHAYAPYSGFEVGAALESVDGTVFTGCNVENASLGLSICAERVAVGAAVAAGHRAFRRIAISTTARLATPPCGACRQVLAEFAPELEVHAAGESHRMLWRLDELLPARFVLDTPNRGADEGGPSHDQRMDG